MKKIYILMTALVLGTAVNAQQDLTASLDVLGAASSDNPVDMSFSITNNGGTIVTGDTLYLAVVVGTTYYDVDFAQENSVSGTVLTQDFENGMVLPIPVPTKTMDEMYALLGGTTGNICGVAIGVGSASVNNQFADDANALDNLACSSYTVTAVTGVEEDAISEISAYPNPVVNSLTIMLGSNKAESINIIDMTGRTIEAITVSNGTETVDMSTYNNGVYFYQVVSNGIAIKTEKFIVSK